MEKIWILFFLVCNSGSHLTSAVYVRSPEEVVVGNGTTDTGSHLTSAVYVRSPEEVVVGNGATDTDCGVPAKTPKVPAGCTSDGLGIVNGEEAVPHSWPWQASLQPKSGSHHFCGGSLIGKKWVVTAAHCQITSKSHRVILGLHDRENKKQKNKNKIKNQKIEIKKVFNHPNWRDKTDDYDIALIKLKKPAKMNENVSSVCVAESCDNYGGMKCVATGWGQTRYEPPEYPLKLQQVCLPIIDKCDRSNYWGNHITSRMICAGGARSGICKGDSGGPLVCKKKNGPWTLVGVTSFMEKGCLTNKPNVFAYVPNLRAWMDRTIADN